MGSTRLLLLLTTLVSVAYGIGDGVSTEGKNVQKQRQQQQQQQQQHEEERQLQGGNSIRSGTRTATTTNSGTNPTTPTTSGGTKRSHHVYPYTDDNYYDDFFVWDDHYWNIDDPYTGSGGGEHYDDYHVTYDDYYYKHTAPPRPGKGRGRGRGKGGKNGKKDKKDSKGSKSGSRKDYDDYYIKYDDHTPSHNDYFRDDNYYDDYFGWDDPVWSSPGHDDYYHDDYYHPGHDDDDYYYKGTKGGKGSKGGKKGKACKGGKGGKGSKGGKGGKEGKDNCLYYDDYFYPHDDYHFDDFFFDDDFFIFEPRPVVSIMGEAFSFATSIPPVVPNALVPDTRELGTVYLYSNWTNVVTDVNEFEIPVFVDGEEALLWISLDGYCTRIGLPTEVNTPPQAYCHFTYTVYDPETLLVAGGFVAQGFLIDAILPGQFTVTGGFGLLTGATGLVEITPALLDSGITPPLVTSAEPGSDLFDQVDGYVHVFAIQADLFFFMPDLYDDPRSGHHRQ